MTDVLLCLLQYNYDGFFRQSTRDLEALTASISVGGAASGAP